ncbi:MAG: hypothetical protein QOF00_1136 [Pseudonocardiales bacterium]|jgi:hypothetical protein|nr:hypothetical protein [Pseudonocardiales bacterium]
MSTEIPSEPMRRVGQRAAAWANGLAVFAGA